jgi:hypothetical protein
MDKKIPTLVLLASLTSEAILSARHESTLASHPHTEPNVQLSTPNSASPISASGGGRAVSATLTYTPVEVSLPPREHVEVNVSAQMTTPSAPSSVGAGAAPATGFKITQIA